MEPNSCVFNNFAIPCSVFLETMLCLWMPKTKKGDFSLDEYASIDSQIKKMKQNGGEHKKIQIMLSDGIFPKHTICDRPRKE